MRTDERGRADPMRSCAQSIRTAERSRWKGILATKRRLAGCSMRPRSASARVDILINNASCWVADTFKDVGTDRLQRSLRPLSAATLDQVYFVDARGSALMIAEFARRHRERATTWGRIVGLSSGGPDGFPEEVSYGAAKAALRTSRCRPPTSWPTPGSRLVHPPVTDTGWITPEVEARGDTK